MDIPRTSDPATVLDGAFQLPLATLPSQVTIYDPHPLIGESVCRSLASVDPGWRYRCCSRLKDLVGLLRSDTALVVISVGDLESPRSWHDLDEAMALVRVRDQQVPFVVITADEQCAHIQHCLNRGARGYIPTSMSLKVAVEALHLVVAGGMFIPPAALRMPHSAVSVGIPAAVGPHGEGSLSPKEISVARALSRGAPNKVIAYDLGMCESTVKVHVRNIMRKMKAKNRTEIAFMSRRMVDSAGPLVQAIVHSDLDHAVDI